MILFAATPGAFQQPELLIPQDTIIYVAFVLGPVIDPVIFSHRI